MLAVVAVVVPCARGQQQQQQPASTQPAISLNFPEAVPLKVLVDYVSRRLGINIIYDDASVSQRVTIQSPGKISEQDLVTLLESVLRMRGLTMVDADVPSFKRIVPVAAAATLPEDKGQSGAVTRIFRLTHADPTRVDPVIKPLLTQPGGNSLPLPDQNAIVVTDFAPTVARIATLLSSVDAPGREVAVEFLPVKNADAGQLARQLQQVMAARARAERGSAGAVAEGAAADDDGGLDVSVDPRTSQLVLVGPRDRLAAARSVAGSLDVPIPDTQSPVRFYKLANTTAADVLSTIIALEGGQASRPADAPQSDVNSPYNQQGQSRVPSFMQAGVQPGGAPGSPAAAPQSPGGPPAPLPGAGTSVSPQNTGALAPTPAADTGRRDAVRTRNAQITADPNTNTIIVVADPAVQKHYEQLIRSLDKRRPQVLVEATIVTLDTTDNFTFGVEISAHGAGPNPRVVTFSQFGLSDTNNQTGEKFLKANNGFNGALLNNSYADVIIQALQTNSRARVSSAPRILVNDNATGTLTSIAEEPFTAINTGNTVATTSFAGYAEAGTEVTLTPHISEDDYLQLEYVVSLSSFTGNRTADAPPPRQRDAIQSRVTIPDGSTIVVGGLNRKSNVFTKNSVPFLGDIPVLEYLFSTRETRQRNTTLFVFLRPVILRDDRFADLKALSAPEISKAEIKGDFPTSEPLEMK